MGLKGEKNKMVYEKLKEVLAAQLNVDEDLISPETNIVDDLGADSLDLVELITTLEDEFNTIITDDRVRELYTVKEIVDFLETLS